MNSTILKRLVLTLTVSTTIPLPCRCEPNRLLSQNTETAKSSLAQSVQAAPPGPKTAKSSIVGLKAIGIIAEYSEDKSLVIKEVLPGSPAAGNGTPQPGDVVTSVLVNKGCVLFEFHRPCCHFNLGLFPTRPELLIDENETVGNSRAKTVELKTNAILLKKRTKKK